MFFKPSFASLKAASWPTYLSMPFEAALKSAKKIFKKQSFIKAV
jgi:hypothetical protein